MKDIGSVFRGFDNDSGEVLPFGARVVDSILQDADRDLASVYSAYTARFGTHLPAPSHPVAYGALVPNQVLPMWRKVKNNWEQTNALQLVCHSAVTFGGHIWLADTEPEDQTYQIDLPAAELERLHPQGKHKLMTPGGRIALNVWEDFPCAVPFRQAPIRQMPPRILNAMAPQPWLSIFGNGIVQEDLQAPTWRLVEMVDQADESDTPPAGHELLYDPTSNGWVITRDLLLPIGFEFAEKILPLKTAPRTLREVMFLGIESYCKHENIQCVGFAWHDTEGTTTPDGNAVAPNALNADVEATRQTVYKTVLNEANGLEFLRLQSEAMLPRFQNGVYDPNATW